MLSKFVADGSAIVAFLRGVNVGGHKKVPMVALKAAFEAMGFRNVRTVLASGNVVFEAPRKTATLDRTIAQGLEKAFGFAVPVILRTVKDLRTVVASAPFRTAPKGPEVRLYVTFLSRIKGTGSRVVLPPPPAGVRIMRVQPGAVFTAVILSPGVGTLDLMGFLEKALGREVTTRNWQTVARIVGEGRTEHV